MHLLHFGVYEAFACGALLGWGLTYLYFTHDRRAAQSVRGLFSFTEGYEEFTKPYGKEPDYSDEYLAHERTRAKLLCRRHNLPFNPNLLAAQIVVSFKLGSHDTLDAVKACWRLKEAAAHTRKNSN